MTITSLNSRIVGAWSSRILEKFLLIDNIYNITFIYNHYFDTILWNIFWHFLDI